MLLWDILVTQQLFTRPHRSIPAVLGRMLQFLALVRYMKHSQPVVVYSAGDNAHMMALWARRVAGTETRVVATHHIVESAVCAQRAERVGRHRARLALCLLRRMLLQADANVSVSNGVGDDLAQTGCIPRERITSIYNPVVPPALAPPLYDPWFHPGVPPVVLAVGRLVDQKDFPTLFLAFAYMSRARVLALSSKYEALACGCPVVSTDCPASPRTADRARHVVHSGAGTEQYEQFIPENRRTAATRSLP